MNQTNPSQFDLNFYSKVLWGLQNLPTLALKIFPNDSTWPDPILDPEGPIQLNPKLGSTLIWKLGLPDYVNPKQKSKLLMTNIVWTYCWECALKRARRRPWPNHRQMIHVVRAWIEQLFPRNDTQPIKMSWKILSLQIGDIC